jgi:hypothetical protein
MASLAHAIEDRFPGARTSQHGPRTDAEVSFEGITYRARLEMDPAARVIVSMPSTDGFELSLRWNDRWTSNAPRAASFDDSFLVETNDLALAGVWLDREAREALLASRYVSSKQSERDTALLIRDGAWMHEVSNDEVCARRRGTSPPARCAGPGRSRQPAAPSVASRRRASMSAASPRSGCGAVPPTSPFAWCGASVPAIRVGCARSSARIVTAAPAIRCR